MSEFPRRGFVLQPSFRVKEVLIVKNYSAGWLMADSRKTYREVDVYENKSAAIEGGRKILDLQQADIDKRQERLNKRRQTLEKCAAKE